MLRSFRAALCAVLAAVPAAADEGMWMPQQIPELAGRLRELGFTGDPKAFADLTAFPMGAIVSLGGCSASFVSPQGLVVTNHHCVQGALQYLSTPERNLIQDGFLAATRAEELWSGPGSRLWVTVSVLEATDAITGRIDPKLGDSARQELIERRIKQRTAECEQGGLRCRVAPFFEGLRYFEVGQLELQDVRLVYAPPRGIGNFGGATDNWQWPRHTGDWSFYRAYAGPDGRPAPYAKDNVPYQPKHWLRVSTRGASPGDPIFVAGYPGRTQRHETCAEVAQRAEWLLPRSIRRSRELLAILEQVTKDDPQLRIKAEPRRRGLSNQLLKNQGVLEGLTHRGLLAEKQAHERALEAWIGSDPVRRRELGAALPGIAAMAAEGAKTRERDTALRAVLGDSPLLETADLLYRLALERPKPDADREPELQQRNWSRIKEQLERLERSYDERLDRAYLRHAALEAAALPQGQRIDALDRAVGLTSGAPAADAAARIDAWLQRLYAGTTLGDTPTRLALLDATRTTLEASRDSLVALAVALHPLDQALRDREKAEAGRASRLRPTYMRALLQWKGGLVSPDANGTLRVTFGTVQGIQHGDGLLHLPQTTLRGIEEKDRGAGDFNAPERLRQAISALRAGKPTPYRDTRLGDVPVDFLSDVDTTGGNSGSAVLDTDFRLCGLLFDGTIDTVGSDLLFDRERTRSIQVDSRYMLW